MLRSLLLLLLVVGTARAATDEERWSLLQAVRRGDAPAVEAMLARGVSAESLDVVGGYPRKVLSVAAEAGHLPVVEVLLRHGANPDGANDFPYRFSIHGPSPTRHAENRKTALMYAAQSGHVAVVRRLIAARAKIDATTIYGETALMLAAGAGRVETVRALIAAGADMRPSATEKNNLEVQYRDYGGTALVYALRHAQRAGLQAKSCAGHLAAAEAIVAAHEARKQEPSAPRDAVIGALYCADAALLSRLAALGAVAKGSDVLLFVNNAHDRPDIVVLLVRAGADVNARAPFGDTPLIRAAASGALRIMEALLEHGAAINAVTEHGESALWHAARMGQTHAVAFLLARGANPNLASWPSPRVFTKGGTALNVAVEHNCLECARALLAAGADPRIPDAKGETPLEPLRRAGLIK